MQQTLKKWTDGYGFKALILAGLVLILLIPLAMISGLVRERGRTAKSAEQEVMEAWGGPLIEAGPFLVIQGTRTTTSSYGAVTTNPFTMMVAPENLNISGNFKTNVRNRGIFSVPLYTSTLTLSGSFNPAAVLAGLESDETLNFEQVELVIMLSSSKGIRKINTAVWNGAELFFQPGSGKLSIFSYYSKSSDYRSSSEGELTSDIVAKIPPLGEGSSSFTVEMVVQGGQYVRFLPVGQNTRVNLSADWASPSFQGGFLPSSSDITDKSFSAQWDVSYLSRNIPLFWKLDGGFRGGHSESFFGVNFFRAIDTYSLNTRAVKYAILFLMIPFLTLFLLEIFTKRRIHPVPYVLAGIGNIVFYLLLLSLSEQLPFFAAYLIAAGSVTVMMTLYSRTLLNSWNKCWYMLVTVVISYILLYAVLNAESYALLIGSIGAFVVTALVMFLTRKLNWYGESASS